MADDEEEAVIDYPRVHYFLEEEMCTAAAENKLSQLRRILMERVDPNWLNGFGLSPLHIAADKGHFEIMKMLVCNKATVDIENRSGVTPLHLAARGDHYKCAQLLLLAGADVFKECWSLCTPREFAPKGSKTRWLLEKREQGVIPDPKDVFEMNVDPIVPRFAIPQPEPDPKARNKPVQKKKK
ncbi:unnamed protein product [Schistocephalus solidus]|uniref:ANK_REP_REGION domain-containing protein n=1 Tax=Schistocephalus solidus TaxID=70667 RepID=A0A183T5N7_SCHSO|nr:unnamed protein product [Schistocephalus solidus]